MAGIVSYVDLAGAQVPSQMAPASTLADIESDEYSRIVVSVDAEYEGEDTFQLVGDVRDLAQSYYPDAYYLAGEGVSTTDLMETIVEDKEKVDVVAILAVLLVLLLATRSLSLPIILVFVIETAIWVNFSIPYFNGMNEFYLAYLIVSTVQLGVTVDYAILFADRYKEERRRLPRTEAVRATVEATTLAILASGTVLAVVGGLLGAMSTHGILSQLGKFLCIGVVMSLFVVLFVLPGFLWALDWVIAKTTRHADFCNNCAPIDTELLDERAQTGQTAQALGMAPGAHVGELREGAGDGAEDCGSRTDRGGTAKNNTDEAEKTASGEGNDD